MVTPLHCIFAMILVFPRTTTDQHDKLTIWAVPDIANHTEPDQIQINRPIILIDLSKQKPTSNKKMYQRYNASP